MTKCGVLTFHRAINYGGVLQAFALAKVLNECGIHVEVIDYYCPSIETLYRGKNIFSLAYIKHFVSAVLYNGTICFNNKDFESFRNKYLPLSKQKYYSLIDLEKIQEDYDFYITGSDQVWSPTCAGFDKAYFLSFVEDSNKKNAYAASFGTAVLDEKLIPEYKNRLSSFNHISVRELSALKLAKSVIGYKEAVNVLDPTLLLEVDQWKKSVEFTKPSVNGKFILIYTIGENQALIDSAICEGKEKNLQVIYITDRVYRKKGVMNLRSVSPEEWLWLFDNAEVVYTNSFHGVSFCVNFEKPMRVRLLTSNVAANSRIVDLLQLFNLDVDNFDETIVVNNYGSDRISKLRQLRLDSFSYINEVVGDYSE